jgi:hypothetical protein
MLSVKTIPNRKSEGYKFLQFGSQLRKRSDPPLLHTYAHVHPTRSVVRQEKASLCSKLGTDHGSTTPLLGHGLCVGPERVAAVSSSRIGGCCHTRQRDNVDCNNNVGRAIGWKSKPYIPIWHGSMCVALWLFSHSFFLQNWEKYLRQDLLEQVTFGCSALAVDGEVSRRQACQRFKVRQDPGKLPPHSASYSCLENYQSPHKSTDSDDDSNVVGLLPATACDWWNGANSDTTTSPLTTHWHSPSARSDCTAGCSDSTEYRGHEQGAREQEYEVSSNCYPFVHPEETLDTILLNSQSSGIHPVATFHGHDASPIGELPYMANGQGGRSCSEASSASIVYVPAENGTLFPVTLWYVVPGLQSMATAPKMAVPRGGDISNQRSNRKPKTNGRGHRVKNKPLSLLEQFRSTTEPRGWTIHRIEGQIVSFCEDYNGSHFVQQRLQAGDAVEHQLVIQEVLPSMSRLRDLHIDIYIELT